MEGAGEGFLVPLLGAGYAGGEDKGITGQVCKVKGVREPVLAALHLEAELARARLQVGHR